MPIFVSDERLKEMAAEARQRGYQAGFKDGQQNGEQVGHIQCLEVGLRFRVALEVNLNQQQLLPRPYSFSMLMDQLYSVMQNAKYRWERAERMLEAHQREYNPDTWQALSADLKNSQLAVSTLQKDLEAANRQLDSAQQRGRELEKKIQDLEGVIANLQNMLDRANKQGK